MATLIFDFPDGDTGRPERTTFRDPLQVLVAREVEEVLAALTAIEAAVNDGMYAAGYVAYEAAPAFEPRMRVRSGGRLPLLWFGIFAGAERPASASTSTSTSTSASTSTSTSGGSDLRGAGWRLEVDRSRYDGAVAAVREAIAEGRTYQVNLTARLRGRLGGEPMALYESLRRAQGAGYHAFLDLGEQTIVSVSPELFFRTAGRRIETRPMKGTRPRGRWPDEDEGLAAALLTSEKDRAENLMIVDLLRNDLGRVCETGSVQVPRLYDVERYRTVWQLTSTVDGRLRPGVGLTEVLAALFPCGSVTGAPKISTMEIIAGLEASPREVYCGAIGMVRPGGDMVFSVPIRTVWWDRATGAAEYGTGGGIVWDSTADAEYDELLAKAVVVREPWPEFALLETMAAENGTVPRLDRHLDRLCRSAATFGIPCPEPAIRAALDQAARTHREEPQKLRLTLAADGSFALTTEPLGFRGGAGPKGNDGLGSGDGSEGADGWEVSGRPVAVSMAARPVHSHDRFLFHKTTHRAVYDTRRAEAPDQYDVLLRNEHGELTELTRGNLVLALDGRLVTPPVASGLLAGCLRAQLLDAGTIEERVVTVDDLRRASRAWSISSARRWVPITVDPAYAR
jgi:para-aminobenzoate synthetase / 4-amino-4-deoxychorismate lyase